MSSWLGTRVSYWGKLVCCKEGVGKLFREEKTSAKQSSIKQKDWIILTSAKICKVFSMCYLLHITIAENIDLYKIQWFASVRKTK